MWVVREVVKDDTKAFAETERMKLYLPEMRKATRAEVGGGGLGAARVSFDIPAGHSTNW